MKNINVDKSEYIHPDTNVFVVNDNAKVIASGNERTPAYVYAQSNNAEVVCFEEGAQIYGDSSEIVYDNPSEFNPATGSKFVTFGEGATICPGNKSVNCALGDNSVMFVGYEFIEEQILESEDGSYEGYKFLENSVCFASGNRANIETLPAEHCVRNVKMIITGDESSIDDYSPSSDNTIISTGESNIIDSWGGKEVIATGNKAFITLKNNSSINEEEKIVEKQTVVCLGKESRIYTKFESTVIVQEDFEWVRVSENSTLAILTKIDNRPDILLFYTKNDEGKYPDNIKENQKIESWQYYRLNNNKELEVVENPNHRP